MSKGARVLLIVLVGGTLLMAATMALGAAAIYSGGTIEVDVEDQGSGSLSLTVPAVLADLAVGLVPSHLVDKALENAPDELRSWMPAVREAWREFARAPDFVLVEISGPNEHVRVEKRGKQLIVLVDSGGERVKVAIPLKTIRRLLEKVA